MSPEDGMKMQEMTTGPMLAAMAAGALLTLLPAATHAANATTAVSWEVAAASCEISTDPPLIIPLGEVDVAPLFASPQTSWKTVGKTPFKIVINSCNGGISALPNVRPSVKVSGTTPAIPGYSNNFLFKNGGDSSGVYIVLVKQNLTDGSDTGNIEVKNNSWLWVPGYGANTVLPSAMQFEIPLTAAVACGNFSVTNEMCKGEAKVRAGDLNASFTLQFEYK